MGAYLLEDENNSNLVMHKLISMCDLTLALQFEEKKNSISLVLVTDRTLERKSEKV